MPQYKLHYFNVRGLGEAIRLTFAAAGQQFEDIRHEHDATWENEKKNFPGGKLPLLEVDGVKLPQSAAILHYVGQQLGLAGKTPMDAAQCHAHVEAVRDVVMPPMMKMRGVEDKEKREQLMKEVVGPELHKNLAALEEQAKEQKGDFAVAGQLTYADLHLLSILDLIAEHFGEDTIKKFPTLMKHKELIASQPKVKEYLATRPAPVPHH